MNKQKLILSSIVGLIIIFILGNNLYKDSQSKKANELAAKNAENLIRPHSTIVGPVNAKVTLVEFLDPACEACSAFYPLVKDIMDKNQGQIRHVIRYAPFHPQSDYIVKTLEASKIQGKYFEALEVLFKYQAKWATHNGPNLKVVWQLLASTGIDIVKLNEDMKDPKFQALVQQEIADAKLFNVTKTPGYFVNGKPLKKFGHKELKDLIDSEMYK